MNPYDDAHALASSLKNSEEFKTYKKVKDEVAAIPELNSMLADFQQKQFKLQAAQFSGQETDEELMKTVQDLYQIIIKDPKAMEYLQAEMMFTRLVSDVYKILEDAIKID